MRESMTKPACESFSCEVCILAGGSSSRMGRDKRRLKLGGATLLQRVKRSTRKLGLPTRVIRRDLVPRCGPLGGVFTALSTSPAEAVLFLSCDMPFVSTGLLESLVSRGRGELRPVFAEQNRVKGFPFLLRRQDLPLVRQQISRQQFSLQRLAQACDARTLRISRSQQRELFNINTPADWRQARERWRRVKLESA